MSATATAFVDELAKLIDTLPETERQVLDMYYVRRMTLHEIAAVLDLTPSRAEALRESASKRLILAFAEWPPGARR